MPFAQCDEEKLRILFFVFIFAMSNFNNIHTCCEFLYYNYYSWGI